MLCLPQFSNPFLNGYGIYIFTLWCKRHCTCQYQKLLYKIIRNRDTNILVLLFLSQLCIAVHFFLLKISLIPRGCFFQCRDQICFLSGQNDSCNTYSRQRQSNERKFLQSKESTKCSVIFACKSFLFCFNIPDVQQQYFTLLVNVRYWSGWCCVQVWKTLLSVSGKHFIKHRYIHVKFRSKKL